MLEGISQPKNVSLLPRLSLESKKVTSLQKTYVDQLSYELLWLISTDWHSQLVLLIASNIAMLSHVHS